MDENKLVRTSIVHSTSLEFKIRGRIAQWETLHYLACSVGEDTLASSTVLSELYDLLGETWDRSLVRIANRIPAVCAECKGKGEVRVISNMTDIGTKPCNDCNGTGRNPAGGKIAPREPASGL